MTLLIVFALLVAGLTALFLGVSVVAHGYLYQDPASKLPLRALAGGVLLGGFLTLWAYIDKNRPGQYDTFFNFSGYGTAAFDEFEAVRWPVGPDKKLKTDPGGAQTEVVVKFARDSKNKPFVQEGTGEKFVLATGEYMTGALRIKGPDDPEPVRYNAKLMKEDERRSVRTKAYPENKDERQFVEEKGSRYAYTDDARLGTLFVPSTGTVFLSLLLNLALLLMWLVVTWPVLRYSFLHALGLTAVGALASMLVLLPLLFKFNKPKAPAPAPAPAAQVGLPAAKMSA